MNHSNAKIVNHVTCFFALLTYGSLCAQPPSNIPTDGLTGWYGFNGNANDESGNGNHGSVTGCQLTEDRFGTSGSAYSFNGAEYITINNSLLPSSPTSFTISAWFNTNTDDGMIISDRGSNINWFKYMVGIAGNVVKAGNYSSGCNSGPQAINSTFDTGEWNHIVDIKNYGDGTHKLYLNGVQVGEEALLCYHASSNGTSIGRWVGITTDGYYEGLIDDIGIWNRALSLDEITALYDVNTATKDSESASSLTAYPNPTSGSIRIANIPQATTLQLFDGTGHSLTATVERQGQDTTLDLSAYPPGLYCVRSGNQTFTVIRE